MTLERIVEVINNILEEDRRRLNIEGKYLFKVKEALYKDADNKVVDIVIVCTFNNYNVVAVRHKVPALTFDTYKEKNLEEVRYMFLEYLLKALKYGKGELDYNLFLNDTFKGYNYI